MPPGRFVLCQAGAVARRGALGGGSGRQERPPAGTEPRGAGGSSGPAEGGELLRPTRQRQKEHFSDQVRPAAPAVSRGESGGATEPARGGFPARTRSIGSAAGNPGGRRPHPRPVPPSRGAGPGGRSSGGAGAARCPQRAGPGRLIQLRAARRGAEPGHCGGAAAPRPRCSGAAAGAAPSPGPAGSRCRRGRHRVNRGGARSGAVSPPRLPPRGRPRPPLAPPPHLPAPPPTTFSACCAHRAPSPAGTAMGAAEQRHG